MAALVRWFWIPQWQIAPGRSSRQHLIAFPAANLVVEPDRVGFSGPTTRASYRDLTGTGWAVGALLRPAAVPYFTANPADLRDAYRPVPAPGLHPEVAAAMTAPDDPAARRTRAVEAFADWLSASVPAPSGEALLANALADLVGGDPAVLTVQDAAARLHVSARTLQRLARRYVGLPPSAMIRRRRLQEAAERLRGDPGTNLAAVAADLGYADQAHLANEFRSVLGFTPSGYRGQVHRPAAAEPDL
ncbi:helix-turn-helix transcriptional regulator [Plantactinospora sp. KBS50]|uniref:helix-turn-helix transcriptional regulator n=1 Tax=Plantactinospora sp. KBS50 TaxID=2024580 RepID=UPI000BAABABD|nr:helix-turn-helix transcriptional regulator [Plantactinospora sp. KBS50]ASW57721.1 DNA-binding protein [Plantactinospora sp. KBS50]